MIKNSVILIDSGIDVNNETLKNNIIGGINLLNEYEIENINDENGHGTQCASVIISMNKSVKLYCIKIVNREGKTSTYLLSKALELCLNVPIPIISISISIVKNQNIESIGKLFSELKKRGRIVLNSVTNGKEMSLPAQMEDVIGIKGSWFMNNEDFIYRNSDIQGIFNSSMQLAYSINNEITFFHGNSKACAVCAGILSREKIDNIEDYLIRNGKSQRYKNFFLRKKEFDEVSYFDKNLLREIMEILNIDFAQQNLKEIYNLPIVKLGINYKKIICILKVMSQKYNISFDYITINLIDVNCFSDIVSLIKKEILTKEVLEII